MISHISIRDFAVIENAEIDFYDGLNIITGETGAGKSVVIEAVSLALGSRADTAFIRSGKDKAVVQLVCDVDGEEYVITRELSSSGKNICRLNGNIVTLSELNEVCRKAADIHGQYDHQSLLDPDMHIGLLDSYKADVTRPLRGDVEEAYDAYKDVYSRIVSIKKNEDENRRKADFMEFELDEIRKAELKEGEDEELEKRVNILQNSEKIFESLAGVYELLSGGESEESSSALSMVNAAVTKLSDISGYSEELKQLSADCEDIFYRLEDIGKAARELRDDNVYSPGELDSAIERLELINNLKRKYGDSIENVIEYSLVLEEKLKSVRTSDEEKAKLSAELKEYEVKLKTSAQKLSEERKKTAAEFEKAVTAELEKLNFNNAEFCVSFSEEKGYTRKGKDKVEFLISTNKGEELKPLSKIASGGEMSRIMLAFKKITGDYDEIPSMIFDEIDTGISGVTATVVGREMLSIAQNHQIICITHLPQIAAFGQNNYRISKNSDEDTTYTTVKHLSYEEKIEEVARLVGGLDITEKTIANARELVEQSR